MRLRRTLIPGVPGQSAAGPKGKAGLIVTLPPACSWSCLDVWSVACRNTEDDEDEHYRPTAGEWPVTWTSFRGIIRFQISKLDNQLEQTNTEKQVSASGRCWNSFAALVLFIRDTSRIVAKLAFPGYAPKRQYLRVAQKLTGTHR